jgi:hypothetical protein
MLEGKPDSFIAPSEASLSLRQRRQAHADDPTTPRAGSPNPPCAAEAGMRLFLLRFGLLEHRAILNTSTYITRISMLGGGPMRPAVARSIVREYLEAIGPVAGSFCWPRQQRKSCLQPTYLSRGPAAGTRS